MIEAGTKRDMSGTCQDCLGRDGQGHPPIRGVPCPGLSVWDNIGPCGNRPWIDVVRYCALSCRSGAQTASVVAVANVVQLLRMNERACDGVIDICAGSRHVDGVSLNASPGLAECVSGSGWSLLLLSCLWLDVYVSCFLGRVVPFLWRGFCVLHQSR
jgi:hypothetical protein